MKPTVGTPVQYFTSRTVDKQRSDSKTKVLLPEPERIGPFAATIVHVNSDDSVSLVVFQHPSRSHPAFEVTTQPTTPVGHYWRPLPTTETENKDV
jgi:hypothetical protein